MSIYFTVRRQVEVREGTVFVSPQIQLFEDTNKQSKMGGDNN